MKYVKPLVAALIVLGVTGSAHAGTKTMATAPAARSYPTSQTLLCSILNLYADPKPITVEVMDYSGGVVNSIAGAVAPSGTSIVADSTGFGAWCRFTVVGNTKKYRAAALFSGAAGYTIAQPAR
jgi:hypothetical protein